MTEREDQKAILVQWAGKLDRREAAVAAREGALRCGHTGGRLVIALQRQKRCRARQRT